MNGKYKKDYEPYQAMGPLMGIFDQRAAEKLNHHANMYGFDAISVGGILSWLMECLSKKILTREELSIDNNPVFSLSGFSVENDSMNNAEIGIALLDSIIDKKGILNLDEGPRKLAWHLSSKKGMSILDSFLFNGFGRRGWMVPNQYWTPGVLSPMAITGKYYMHYANEFLPPRQLGRKHARRMLGELTMDNLGFCRFHRLWAEDMLPDLLGALYGIKDEYKKNILLTAGRINSRNASVMWETERNIDFIHTFLKRRRFVEGDNDSNLVKWIEEFDKDKKEAALNFWYEIHKGIFESLREF
jgi:glyceraldehyde-3-phosphate dehydrogenase (ferredoxin)